MLELSFTMSNQEIPPGSLRQLYMAFLPGRLRAGTIRSRFTLHGEHTPQTFTHADPYFAALESWLGESEMREEHDDAYLEIRCASRDTTIALRTASDKIAGRILQVLSDRIADHSATSTATVKVFLGHGRDHQWRALRDHLLAHSGIEVLTYEGTAAAGDPARSVLERLARRADLAIVLHTREARERADWPFAVPNVIHETGLFQGALGWDRTLIVREDGCRPATNAAGLTEVRFSDGNIREAFGDIVAFLLRSGPGGTPWSSGVAD